MEVANARAMEVTSSAGSTKRRKLDSVESLQASSSTTHLANQCSCVMNSPENLVSDVSSTSSVRISTQLYFAGDSFKDSLRSPDLKAEESGTEISFSIINDGFSRETTPLSELGEEYSDVIMESTKNKTSPANSRAASKRPPTAEIEEFFSAAEKYEQKRFADKYNYDIVKDLPLEGRYQWVRLKP